MKVRYGFFCSTADNRLSTNHRFTLKNLNKENLYKTVDKNIADLIKILNLSRRLNCSIFRLGSHFIPFFSHPRFNKSWLHDVRNKIRLVADQVKNLKIRLTMHPGQYVVLNSEKKEIIRRSLDELAYHFWVLDQMGVDENGVVVIHLGKSGNNKGFFINKFIETIGKNQWLKKRLAIENDERFSARETLSVAKITGLPMVFDYFHHQIFPSKIKIIEVFETWKNRRPEFHLSSAHFDGVLRKHSDYIEKKDWQSFLKFLKPVKKDFDVIFEAKKKEKAIIRLMNIKI